MACTTLACIGNGGCVEDVPAGTVGQVMTVTATGVAWGNASDDQTAAEVPFTPYQTIQSTTVQAAIQEIVDEFCPVMLASCSINALSDVDTATSAPTTDQSVLSWDGTNWVPTILKKVVFNSGATIPIIHNPDGGSVPLVNTNFFDSSGETNDIIPIIDLNGIRYWNIRPIYGLSDAGAFTSVIPYTFTELPVTVVSSNPATAMAANGFTIPVDGVYSISILVTSDPTTTWDNQDENLLEANIFINGAIGDIYARAFVPPNAGFLSVMAQGTRILALGAGTRVSPGARHFQVGNVMVQASMTITRISGQ